MTELTEQERARVRATWPIERWPIPSEWRAWFVSCPEWQQEEIATRVLDAAQRSSRCFEADHEGQIEHFRARAALVSPDPGSDHHPDCPAAYYTDRPERCRCVWKAALDLGEGT